MLDIERRYRALVEKIPAITYIEEPGHTDGTRLAYVSAQSERILGYTPEELMSEPGHLVQMLHPDDVERVLALNARCDATGEPFCAEYRVLAKDGREVWLHSEATLVQGESGSLPFWHGVAIDITGRKRAELARGGGESAETAPERATSAQPS